MGKYSDISYMRVKNFRNIGDATISFEESPVVALLGDNEAGKTSIVKAFIVAGLNGFTRRQKNYIKDGTNGFGIEVGLKDGSGLQRVKTSTYNQLFIRDVDGNITQHNKIDAGSVPEDVQKLMGLIVEEETKEYLQIRTYEDQLLFVVTPGSTNYKVMYNALNVEQLSAALKLGNEEANEYKNRINEAYLVNKSFMDRIRSIRVLDIEPAVNVKNRLKERLNTLDKLERAKGIKDTIVSLENRIGAYSNLGTEIDSELANKIDRAYRLEKEIVKLEDGASNYTKLEGIDEINVSNVEKVIDVIERKKEVERLTKEIGATTDIEKLGLVEINEAQVYKIVKAMECVNKQRELQGKSVYSEIDNLSEVNSNSIEVVNKLIRGIQYRNTAVQSAGVMMEQQNEIAELSNMIANCGALVTDCPNCGETVVMPME